MSLPLLLDRSSSWGWKLFRREISQGHMLQIRKQANPKWKLQNMGCVCFTKKTLNAVTITVYINPLIPKKSFSQSVSEKTTFLKRLLLLKSQPKVPKEARLLQHSVHYPAGQRAHCEFNQINLEHEQVLWAPVCNSCFPVHSWWLSRHSQWISLGSKITCQDTAVQKYFCSVNKNTVL